ncbi:MAG: 37S ribosomal protein S24, mitochondrial [Bogoriella megaspora]|nr:MAG: 37S ribosomal protein S24, mitochondrial [Bogoriella megaspora]
MAASLKRLRLRACCPPQSTSVYTLPAVEPSWRPQISQSILIRPFTTTPAYSYPPPQTDTTSGAAPISDRAIAEREPRGFWSMGEESDELGPDEEFDGEDLTAVGHTELDAHRELREFARIAAWEMPLLSKLAKPFTPPTKASPLRFRYTTYLHETHPSQYKIVLEFSPTDLLSPSATFSTPLTSSSLHTLRLLAGPRYNPTTETIKMSCDAHTSQIANKRTLLDQLDALIVEARKGEFKDVPLDTRHVGVSGKKGRRDRRRGWVSFPEEWKMTEERRRVLEESRERGRLEMEGRKVIDGGEVVKGVLEGSLGRVGLERERETVPVGRGRGRL